jgi:hypothetical protein
MKKLALAALAAAAFAAPAFAEEWDFVLLNDTGKPIKTIDLAEAGTGSWVANKLDPEMKREGVTGPGKRTTVHFDKGAACKYDIKATFADDSSAVWSGINLCDNAFVTLSYAGGKPSFKAN